MPLFRVIRRSLLSPPPAAAAAAFQTLVDPTLDANATANNTDNQRVLVDTAAYGVGSACTQIRVTFTPPSTGDGCNLNPVYVGHQAAAGNAWDFDGNQVQLLFSGAALCAMTAGGANLTSDIATFTFNPAKKLLIAFFVTGSSTDDVRYKATLSNFTGYHDNGAVGSSTAATTTPASQGAWASHACMAVDLIEVL